MNDFLTNMKSLVLYQHINKKNMQIKRSNNESNDNLENEIQLEMLKFKKAIASSSVSVKINNIDFKDYSSSLSNITSPIVPQYVKTTFYKI